MKIEYEDESNVTFIFTSADGSVSFTTTATANAGSGFSFGAPGKAFYMWFSDQVTNPKFNSIVTYVEE